MFTIISRITHYGLMNFRRNGWLSTATIAIMVIALLVFNGLLIFRVITAKAIESIQDKIDISVYFKTNTGEDDILNIKQALTSLPEIKDIEYISKDQALDLFKTRHQNDETITQAVTELNENPLEASLNIKAWRADQYAAIAAYLENSKIDQFVDNVSYAKNQVVIDRLTAIINTTNRGGLILTLVLAIIAGLVIFNTIRLAIYSGRDEINIMRLVGASNFLVRGPYVIQGILSGIIAATISLLVAAPVLYFIFPYLNTFIPGLNIFSYFIGHLSSFFLYQLLFGVLIGSVSSVIAVRRYLNA